MKLVIEYQESLDYELHDVVLCTEYVSREKWLVDFETELYKARDLNRGYQKRHEEIINKFKTEVSSSLYSPEFNRQLTANNKTYTGTFKFDGFIFHVTEFYHEQFLGDGIYKPLYACPEVYELDRWFDLKIYNKVKNEL